MLVSSLLALIARHKNARRSTHSPRPTMRPELEILEDRLVPAQVAGDFVWTGATNNAWNLASNWVQTTTIGTYPYPGANGSTND